MAIFTGFLVFAILWWLVFFMVLPFGVRTAEEAGEKSGEGHAPSAPVRPRLGLKILITTIVAGVLWAGFYFAVTHDLVSFRPPPGE